MTPLNNKAASEFEDLFKAWINDLPENKGMHAFSTRMEWSTRRITPTQLWQSKNRV